MEKTFKVPVKYTFSGFYEIKAESAEQAKELAQKHCGLVIGGDIHTTLDDEDVNWEFSAHPDTTIGRVTKA